MNWWTRLIYFVNCVLYVCMYVCHINITDKITGIVSLHKHSNTIWTESQIREQVAYWGEKFYVMPGNVPPQSHTLHIVLSHATYCTVRYARFSIYIFFSVYWSNDGNRYYSTDTNNIIKFHTVCISQISVFEVVLKYQSQTIYITNISFGRNICIFVYGFVMFM